MDDYDIEEASLRLGVAETFDSLDLFSRHFHRDKTSTADSGSTLLGSAKTHPEHWLHAVGSTFAYGASSLGRPRRLVVRPGDWGPPGLRGESRRESPHL